MAREDSFFKPTDGEFVIGMVFGGHTRAILETAIMAKFIVLDRDPVGGASSTERLNELNIQQRQVDGMFGFGASSMQSLPMN